jgi:hypothetical protein
MDWMDWIVMLVDQTAAANSSAHPAIPPRISIINRMEPSCDLPMALELSGLSQSGNLRLRCSGPFRSLTHPTYPAHSCHPVQFLEKTEPLLALPSWEALSVCS